MQGAGVRYRTDLPGCKAGGTEQMAAGLYPDVLAVLRADFAQLERAAHLAVQLVLLLGNLHTRRRKMNINKTALLAPLCLIGWEPA